MKSGNAIAVALLVAGLLGLGAPGTLVAAETATLKEIVLLHAEGSLVIEPDGSVGTVTFETRLTPELQAPLDRRVRTWRFHPVLVGGLAQRARTRFRIVLSGTKHADAFDVRIDDVDFSDSKQKTTLVDGTPVPIESGRLRPPAYPTDLMRAGAVGRILLAIRVAPDGRAGEVQVVQSMLYDTGLSEGAARRAIRGFSVASAAAAKQWTFKLPPSAVPRKESDMTVFVPVEFLFNDRVDDPGQWLTAQRLPKVPVKWLPADEAQESPGVAGATNGEMITMSNAFRLTSPVAGTAL